jgi:hypothetical protein
MRPWSHGRVMVTSSGLVVHVWVLEKCLNGSLSYTNSETASACQLLILILGRRDTVYTMCVSDQPLGVARGHQIRGQETIRRRKVGARYPEKLSVPVP